MPVWGTQIYRPVLIVIASLPRLRTPSRNSVGKAPKSDSKSLKHLIGDPKSSLGALADRAAAMVALRDLVADALPDGLGNHITDANLSADQQLTVVCASPAWAARLRFHTDTMLAAARRGGHHAVRCRVATRPAR